MDIAERVNNVSACRDPFLVNVEFWPDIASHRRVRLRNPRRLSDDGIKNGRFRLPDIEGYARQLSGKRGHSCRLWAELQMEAEQRPNFGRCLVVPFRMTPEEGY